MAERRCSQIHISPGLDGMGVETPCVNEAAYELGEDPDWLVCEECLRGLQKEGIEEASAPRRLVSHG